MSAGVKTFNFIRNNSTETFVNVVPSATEDNIASIRDILFNDAYQPQLNEFVNNLINRISLTIVRNKSFSNPLALFKKGAVPLGSSIQDIYENPAEAEQYEYSNTAMAKLLTITDPDTHVAYYQRNRKDIYTKTISREGLQAAFVSWEKFEDFISAITQSLYSGNYIDEFNYTKALIDGAYANDKVVVEQVTKPIDEATSKAFVKKVRTLFAQMSFPSKEYNAYSKFSGAKGTVTTWTDPERVVLVVRADVLAEVDVETLSQAFNLSYADLKARIVTVDKFDHDELLGVICDEAWLQIYDNIFRFDEAYNARVMAWNEYLHAWGTFAICPFANAIALATTQPSEVETITIPTIADLTIGEPVEVTITVSPAGATSTITFESSDSGVFTVRKISNTKVELTGHSEGRATLKVEGGMASDQKEVGVTL